ncbi:MAG: hypothetical protein QOK40_3471 [Miltoncostaeaceae bacterium]|nr:hypothetical protein [Miltoncostaeaceae bacterium]
MGRRRLVRRWKLWGRALAGALLVGAVVAAGAWWLVAPTVLVAVLGAFFPDLVHGWHTVGRFGAAERAARQARRLIAAAPPDATATWLAARAYQDAAAAEDDDLARLAGMRQAAQLARAAARNTTAARDPS